MAVKAKAKKSVKGTKGAKDKMAAARAARGSGLASKFSGMTVEALLKVKSTTDREDVKAHYAIRRALRAKGYKISENRPDKPKKGKGAAKAAVNKAAPKGKAAKKTAAKAKGKKAKGGDWEDED